MHVDKTLYTTDFCHGNKAIGQTSLERARGPGLYSNIFGMYVV